MALRMLVIADTHGRLDEAAAVIQERGPWDIIIHLGDSVLDAVSLAADLGVDITAVPGNNEYPAATGEKKRLLFSAGRVKFLALHGDEFELSRFSEDYEEALSRLAGLGRDQGARVVLFGHTHYPELREIYGVLILNPGAMGHGDRARTYGELIISDDEEIRAQIKEA